ncbi:hypothetical protein NCAS_0E02050 [Naumovozyma castellii]|uniref:Protoporphyrinogen oxidase n=1 Tax=Naumovozyma castellii TaxID=27288 RepID=G0VFK8_NAUCA|nr:hypothetical protein NCAS_0E02050 [Naumovozyma castellii CBS 4309]CCC70275.1 hypothetical protein NCAS_0E02050 [Naumovozyma castellii CBS 4309]
MLLPLKKLPNNSKVAVVGGGVSGLMFTYFLGKLRPDIQITLFEGAKRTDGWINSWNTKDAEGKPIMLERGPRTLRGVSDGTVLIMDILRNHDEEKSIQCIDANSNANRKFLLDPNDHLVQVPNSLGSFLKFISNPLSKGLFSGLLGEWFRKPSINPTSDETVKSLMDRRYGNDLIGKNLLSAIYHGIYADDISTLSAQKTAAKTFYAERQYGSTMKAAFQNWKEKLFSSKSGNPLSKCLREYQTEFNKDSNVLIKLSQNLKQYPMLGLVGGLETLPKVVRKALDGMENVQILVNNPVTKISYTSRKPTVGVKLSNGDKMEGFDHLRLTNTPDKMASMVSATYRNLVKDLKLVEANTVVLVNFFLQKKDVIPKELEGFGYLVPSSNPNPEKVLGVIFDSVIENNFKPFDLRSKNKLRSNDYTKLTIMVGGHLLNKDGKQTIPAEDECISQVKDALNRHMKISREDLDDGLWVYTVAEKCFPHYFVGYNEWQARVEKEFLDRYDGKVSLGGMGFAKGPGVPDVVVDGFQDALKMK